MRALHVASIALMPMLIAACGSDVHVEEHSATAQGGGFEGNVAAAGGGGQTGAAPAPYVQTVEVHAPDEYSIRVVLTERPDRRFEEVAAIAISGDRGPLEVLQVAMADATTMQITTARQKLGATYRLRFEGAIQEGPADFLAADTAKFWTVDLSKPDFPESQITAERRVVGKHAVAYVQAGMRPSGVEEGVRFFDESIYPIETELFTEPGDQDDNGRVLLLGLHGRRAYAGYFTPVNAVSDEEAMATWGYHSNEMEMLYINVEFGDFDARTVVAHELQHLLYFERHPSFDGWDWHNEGLAECAVHAVNGVHQVAVDYYSRDPRGGIRAGTSIVDWQYGNYDQYVLSYLYLTYVAGQLGGLEGYRKLFDLEDGHPATVDAMLKKDLGIDFGEAQLRSMIASFLQNDKGIYSYNGFLSLPRKPLMLRGATTRLQPFAGTFALPGVSPFGYPGDQGPNIVYVGIDANGTVDRDPPFNVNGGALVVLNQAFDVTTFTAEPAGTLKPSVMVAPEISASSGSSPALLPLELTNAWKHPPPFDPRRLDRMRRWQRATAATRSLLAP